MLMLAAALLLPASCVENLDPNGPAVPTPSTQVLTKVANQSLDSDSGTLLLRLSQAPDAGLMDLLRAKGAVSVERLFTSTPGKEELEQRFGLDQWYLVAFPDALDKEQMAASFAELDAVRTVEYNSFFHKTSDCITYPYTGPVTPATKADDIFNDPMLRDQWQYANHGNTSIATTAYAGGDINVEPVWQTLTTGDNAIIVAVIDEAVQATHPDLAANMWFNEKERNGKPGVDDDGNGYIDDINGFNFVDMTAEYDLFSIGNSGHGTHCAGSIAAVNNNGQGVSGVAGGSGKGDGVRIMSCQIFTGNQDEQHPGSRGATVSNTAKAIKYAADNGASLISCSYGYSAGAFKSDNAYMKQGGAEADAIHYFEACKNNDVLDGNVAIFSSGNDGKNFAGYPGALQDIISVSAFGPDYLPTYYTNYGPGCNITAPGGEAYLAPWTSYAALILSTLPPELNDGKAYGYMQGTSMACPHVTGVAALGLAYARKLGKHFTVQEFKNLLVTSARDFDTRLNGTKTYAVSSRKQLNLYEYRKQMGSGAIDAWLLCMQIEGIPCLTAKVGENQWLDISPYFGTASINLTYLGRTEGEGNNTKYYIEVSDEVKNALGLAEEPYVQYGRLWVHPTKIGAAKITVKAVGGGTEVGGGDKIGGMAIHHDISIIARNLKSSNGGWL